MYHALHRSGLAQDYICQDILVPASQADAFIGSITNLWDIFPLSICGINEGTIVPAIYNSTTLGKDGLTTEKFFNVGIYGPRKFLTQTAQDENRMLEDLTTKHHGVKWLYADTYYTKDEFFKIYDVDRLERLREKYDATSLPDLYEKTRTLPRKGHRFWKTWPLPGIYGALSALKGGHYLLKRTVDPA
jgi:Delta24-sterol reductase